MNIHDMVTDYIDQSLEPARICLARPGKRLLGELNSIRPDSFRLSIRSNNTNTIDFEIDKCVDGEPANYYDELTFNQELYVTGSGWFAVNATPEVHFDGINEYKSVSAESLEIKLQNFDLTGFKVNCGSTDSWEMMAPDNTYMDEYEYKMFREQVVFYRDTSGYDKLLAEFSDTAKTVSALRDLLYTYPSILTSWRITFCMDTYFSAIRTTIAEYKRLGKPTGTLEGFLDELPETQDDAKKKIKPYPDILKYISIEVNTENPESDTPYTIEEIIALEKKRMDHLSLLWLILNVSEAPWSVGLIDDYIDAETSDRLADSIGNFEVDSQDVYSFLTQEVAGFFQCLFEFDTDTCKINAVKIENYGQDTNVFLSFHNVQNSLTISPEEEIYTVYRVSSSDELTVRDVNYMDEYVFDYSYFVNTKNFTDEFVTKYNHWLKARDDNRNAFIEMSQSIYKDQDALDEIYYRVPDSGSDIDEYSSYSPNQLNQLLEKYEAEQLGYETSYNGDIEKLKASVDGPKYNLIVNVIIENLKLEIENRDKDSYEEQEELSEDYIFNLDEYGALYGIRELSNLQKVFENAIDAHKKNGTNTKRDDNDSYYQSRYEDYLKYAEAHKKCSLLLKTREQEYTDQESKLKATKEKRLEMAEYFAITSPDFGFTEQELRTYEQYYRVTDYVNNHIVITNLDNTNKKMEKAKNLYEQAMDELYVSAHPQYSYHTEQDNILALPEFSDWRDQFKIGNFIRITTGEHTQAKLRLISITFNPLATDNSLEFDFSNMIQYRSKRNDYISMMNSALSAQKNQISSLKSGSAGNSSFSVDSDLILQLINNGVFTKHMNNVIAESVTANRASFDYLASNFIQAAKIDVNQITGKDGDFETFFSKYIDTEYLVANLNIVNMLKAEDILVDELHAGSGTYTGILKGVKIIGDDIEAETIIASKIVLKGDENSVVYQLNNLGELDVSQMTTEELRKYQIDGGKAIIAKSITAEEIDVKNLWAGVGEFLELNTKGLSAITAKIGHWAIEKDNIVGSYNSYLQGGFLKSSNYKTDTMGNALSGCLIDLNDFSINSPSFRLDSSGIVMKGNITLLPGSSVPGSTVNVGDKTLDETLEEANQKIEDSIQFKLETFSSAGILFTNSIINTILSATLYRGNTEATEEYDDSCFIWHRISDDPEYDAYWDSQHAPAKKLRITSEDVYKQTSFRCDFVLQNETRASSSIV